MAKQYQWYGKQWSKTGCPGEYNAPGWYSGDTLITATYINPTTNKPYTPQELVGLGGGGGGTTTPAATTPIGTGGQTSTVSATRPKTIEEWNAWYTSNMDNPPKEYPGTLDQWKHEVKASYEKAMASLGYGHEGLTPTGEAGEAGTTTPTFGEGAGAGIPTPEVTPAPPYEISPEQQAFEEMLGGKITDWVEAGGYGIPEETQNLMIQKQTDSLKAREQENIRVMRNNMERRGITNSGFVFANEQAIRSNTSVAIAGAIADVQIKSALMKMASFEKAMGAASQFLGYLSEQSQLKYQPEFATWQAEQMAKMQAWQGKLDIYKMELNQAYQTQNIQLQAQLQSQLNQEQNAFEQQMLELEIEASQQAAQAQGIGSIIGTILGIGASLIFGVPLFGF